MFTLIDLPYKSLAPVISDQTLSFHHGKHLQTYVNNLNKLVVGTEFEGKSLEDIIVKTASVISSGALGEAEKSKAKPVFNNAGQILNHELYFLQFRSFDADAPQDNKGALGQDDNDDFVISSEVEKSPLRKQIVKQWGSPEAFQAEFEAKGAGLFGSGWVWLQADVEGNLSIGQYANADNPVAHGFRPILTFDVWEHAYYLDYQNRRAGYLKALWSIVNWAELENRYESR